MVCFNPNYIYLRHHYPINANSSEKELKRLNKPSFNKYIDKWIQYPVACGKCDGCRLDRANDWATRITNEAETWDNVGIFITLTYNDKNLPFTKSGKMTLQPEDIKNFKKRLRKYATKHELPVKKWTNPATGKEEYPIRTFECGEYGDKYGRPHYHMIVFNWKPKDLKYWKTTKDGNVLYNSKTLQKIWGKGFTPIGSITYQSASYCCRYTMKKSGIHHKRREYYDTYEYDTELDRICPKTKYRYVTSEVVPEFIRMSTKPGIGKKYFIDNFEDIRKNSGIMIKDKKIVKIKRIPRYYKKIWEQLDWQDYERWKYHQQLQAQIRIDKEIATYNLPSDWSYDKKLKFANDKKIEKYMAKMDMLKKRSDWE